VSQHFFATAGIPLVAGRDFATTDAERSPAVAIVNQAFVREFLKKEGPDSVSLGLNETVQRAVSLTRSELEKDQIALRVELSSDLPLVRGDQVQLRQVILNLIMNAREAMASVNDRPRELLVTSQKSPDGGVSIAVRDSGVGIRPDDMDKIFDALFTTKATGMGMDLSLSRSIIEAHGGRIWAEVNDGPGVTVRFNLPPAGAGEPSPVAGEPL